MTHRHGERHDPPNERPAEKEIHDEDRCALLVTSPDGNESRKEIEADHTDGSRCRIAENHSAYREERDHDDETDHHNAEHSAPHAPSLRRKQIIPRRVNCGVKFAEAA